MKKFLFIVLFICMPLCAQDDDFGASDVEDITVEEVKKSGWIKNFFRKNLSGSIGHSSILSGDSEYRGYSHLRFRFEKDFSSTNTKIAAEGLYDYTQIRFIQVPDDELRTDLLPEKELKYNKRKFRAEEAYIEQEIFDSLSVSYGIQKVVWGQFEPFSPTNLVFPFNLSTTDVDFSKVKGTLSQEAGIIRYFPTSNIALSLYAFPKLTYDPILQKGIDEPGQYTSGGTMVDGTFEMPKKSERLQTGARLMYYPSWGAMGFTYYKGFDTSNLFIRGNIRVVGNSGIRSEVVTFTKQEMFGFELAVPKGNWVHKIEYSAIKSAEALYVNADLNDITLLDAANTAYVNAILNQNGGNLQLPIKQDILAIGTTGNLKRWHLNLTLFYLKNRYTEDGERILELGEKTIPNSDDGYDGPLFPGFVISRYLNDDKTSELGLAAGIISNGQGVALFYKKTSDSWVYGAALQSISYFSGGEEAGAGDSGYKRKDDSTTGLLLSLTRKF